MEILTMNGISVAVIEKGQMLASVSDVMDSMVEARFNNGCAGLIVYGESLAPDFFELRTGLAGEILQKFSNYDMKIAIIGDFTGHPSKSLRDFIYECNKGNRVFFKPAVEGGLASITASENGRAL